MTFKFQKYDTVKIASSATSNSDTLAGAGANWIRVYNEGPSTAFVTWATSTPTATTADLPIPPNSTLKFRWDPTEIEFATICETGKNATVFVTPTIE